jgi:hypothetical protein
LERQLEQAALAARNDYDDTVGHAAELAAKRALDRDVLERTTVIESRIGRELDRALNGYRALQKRNLGDLDD